MSLQNALLFIARARRDDALRAALRGLPPDVDGAAVEQLGQALGLPFTVAELQEAYRQDWIMHRYLHPGTRP